MSKNGSRITPANQWKRQIEELDLPECGFTVGVIRPAISDYIMENGTIPASLLNAFAQSIASEQEMNWNPTGEEMKSVFQMANEITIRCFASPVIVDEPDYENGEIALVDVPQNDRYYVMQWALGVENAEALNSFLEEQRRKLADVQNGSGHGDKTVAVNGHQ